MPREKKNRRKRSFSDWSDEERRFLFSNALKREERRVVAGETGMTRQPKNRDGRRQGKKEEGERRKRASNQVWRLSDHSSVQRNDSPAFFAAPTKKTKIALMVIQREKLRSDEYLSFSRLRVSSRPLRRIVTNRCPKCGSVVLTTSPCIVL